MAFSKFVLGDTREEADCLPYIRHVPQRDTIYRMSAGDQSTATSETETRDPSGVDNASVDNANGGLDNASVDNAITNDKPADADAAAKPSATTSERGAKEGTSTRTVTKETAQKWVPSFCHQRHQLMTQTKGFHTQLGTRRPPVFSPRKTSTLSGRPQ